MDGSMKPSRVEFHVPWLTPPGRRGKWVWAQQSSKEAGKKLFRPKGYSETRISTISPSLVSSLIEEDQHGG